MDLERFNALEEISFKDLMDFADEVKSEDQIEEQILDILDKYGKKIRLEDCLKILYIEIINKENFKRRDEIILKLFEIHDKDEDTLKYFDNLIGMQKETKKIIIEKFGEKLPVQNLIYMLDDFDNIEERIELTERFYEKIKNSYAFLKSINRVDNENIKYFLTFLERDDDDIYYISKEKRRIFVEELYKKAFPEKDKNTEKFIETVKEKSDKFATKIKKAAMFYQKCKYIPNEDVLLKFPEDQIDKFDKTVWFSLAKNDLYYQNATCKSAFVEAALSLGIFENDDNVEKRRIFLDKIAKRLPRDLKFCNNDTLKGDLLNLNFFNNYFKIKSEKLIDTYYVFYPKIEQLLEDDKILSFFDNYECAKRELNKLLFPVRSGNEVSYGQKMTQTEYENLLNRQYCSEKYKKAINYIYEKSFKKRETIEYEASFNENLSELMKKDKFKAKILEKQLRFFYWNMYRDDIMSPDKLHRIFDGTDMKFKDGFFEFFQNNLESILKDEEKQNLISKIQVSWENIVKQNLGQKITFEKCNRYFEQNTYKNIDIEKDFEISKLSINSGYSQQQFDRVKELHPKQLKRTKSSIPLIEESEDKEGYRYKVLRLDDPTAIFVGELTNCCQAIDNLGESCMEHSVLSENGRVLVVLDEHNRVVSQSWIWRNKNILCFDNVEAVKRDKDNRKNIDTEILNTIKRAATEFLNVDDLELEKWKKKQLENLNNRKNEITKEEYEKEIALIKKQVDTQKLSKITVGKGYTDISLHGLEEDKDNVYPEEYVYYIKDSRTQYILAKNSDKTLTECDDVKTIPLYEDGKDHKKLIEIEKAEFEIEEEINLYSDDEFESETLLNSNGSEENSNFLSEQEIIQKNCIFKFKSSMYIDDDIELDNVLSDTINVNYSREKTLRELQQEKQKLFILQAKAKALKNEYERLLEMDKEI